MHEQQRALAEHRERRRAARSGRRLHARAHDPERVRHSRRPRRRASREHVRQRVVGAAASARPGGRRARTSPSTAPRITASSRRGSEPAEPITDPSSAQIVPSVGSSPTYLGARSARCRAFTPNRRWAASAAAPLAGRRAAGGGRLPFPDEDRALHPQPRLRDVEGRTHDRGREARARPRDRGSHPPPSPTHGRPRCGACVGAVWGYPKPLPSSVELPLDTRTPTRSPVCEQCAGDGAPSRRGRARAGGGWVGLACASNFCFVRRPPLAARARPRAAARAAPSRGATAARAVRLQADGELGEPERARAPRPLPSAARRARARAAPGARARRRRRARRALRASLACGACPSSRTARCCSLARTRPCGVNGGVVAAILSPRRLGVAGSWLARAASRAQLGGVALRQRASSRPRRPARGAAAT